MSDASLRRDGDGDVWRTRGPGGDVTIRFTGNNDFGVMDHWVTVRDGSTVYMPMRITANGDGADVTLTLMRQPGMDDAAFAADAAQIGTDLARLKALAEG